ncbi:PREDICTED: max dimerization protein 3 isoform X1 [Cercocebus atys]|uniref:max dimerization protein 3 isoform X1 n=1 Tax=Cercocebus atys TaxID=9531 RepID=UPI0005F3766D|nr:PREDICTED: max dimerization protein 3 isoform X1 [Cercocebus atys]
MEPVASNIQVLLQAAEFLERREREAEHGYASLCPHRSPGPIHRRKKRPPQAPGAQDSGRSVHNELEKRRRAQLKRCLERLKQQMPLGADCARYTTLSLLRRARMHIQKLEDQEQRARRLKERLRSKQQSLQRQLEQLRGLAAAAERERLRTDSLDSSGLSSERSDSDQGECPEAEGLCGPWGKPGLLIGPLPAQRSWRWMWRAWCLGVRPSCCGASSPARSTATRTVAAPGYDVPHPGVASLPSARARPTCQAGALPKPLGLLGVTCWNGLKGPLCGNRCSPNTLLLAARQALWKGKGQDSSGPPWTPAGQAAWA